MLPRDGQRSQSGAVRRSDFWSWTAVLTNARMAAQSVSSADADAIQPVTVQNIETLSRCAADVARQMMAFASRTPRTG